ncbi:MAG: NusA-like transcription termination signal-binding factor [Candidatus Aenigmarchaeota archaeon]|nr:NusA-like transcription termination signal-binding factor [Candidatus Aenigmarchaeota archaeon]
MNLKLGTEEVRNISFFVKATGIQPKDCLIAEDCIYFVVDSRKVFAVIGRGGENIRKLSMLFRKRVRIFGYYPNPEETIRAMIPQAKGIRMENGSVLVSIPAAEKSKIIGRHGTNIKAIKEMLKRHFGLMDLRLRY